MNDFLKIYSNVKEYYELFDSCYSNMLLEECLWAAYCVALLEEVSDNFREKISPLLSSTKLNESNEEEKESKGLLVVDDDCKETESRVSGMDVDNELVDNVTAETMDDTSNSKEVEKESIESVGYVECFEENVNAKGKEIEYVNLILLDEPCEEKVEGLGIETKESVENNKCLETTDKFIKGNDFVNHDVESNDLGKENGFDDLSLVEMTTMLEKSKGHEVKNIRKRYGLGIAGYGYSLFPIPGLDELGRHDGADEIEL
ncbi:hypothetical protein Tco_0624195 [Tanacetum coccineum]|uniref:Uncharacterized protein n=1 Tax=Tanacetum coccineum TaxID=301880 RepID=A0ABQ4WDC3_9ASTR